jgi:hypothetical protein
MKFIFDIPFNGFEIGSHVVKCTDNDSKDNRLYVVQAQHSNYYVGRTEISSVHGDQTFMIDTNKLRLATSIEEIAHCRLLYDSDY